jgi:Peptidase family M23
MSTAGYNALSFLFRKDMNANIQVGIRNGDTHIVPAYVPLSSYIIPNQSTPLVNGEWYAISVPLSDLQSVNKPLGGVVFAADQPGTLYVDNVVLFNSLINMKLPLPGGKSWYLTVEAGGKAYDGIDDVFHYEDKAYFSIDFTNKSSGNVQETNVPIRAAAGGVVIYASSIEDQYNGYYVVIDHDNDGNLNTGYTTWYAHMQPELMVSQGDEVVQGQQLGVMGNTGASLGTHLHFGVHYNGKKSLKKADGSIDQETALFLRSIRIEGLKIEDYKVIPTSSGYYPSNNLP